MGMMGIIGAMGAMGAMGMMGVPGVPDEMGVPCGCGYFLGLGCLWYKDYRYLCGDFASWYNSGQDNPSVIFNL